MQTGIQMRNYSRRKRLACSNSSRKAGVRRFSRRWARRCSSACKRGFYGFCIRVGDVAPHGVGAGAEARHLAQGAAAYVFELRRVAYLFLSTRSKP